MKSQEDRMFVVRELFRNCPSFDVFLLDIDRFYTAECMEKYSHPAPRAVKPPLGKALFCCVFRCAGPATADSPFCIVHLTGEKPARPSVMCECGAAKLKLPGHSDWCPAKEKE